MSGHQLPIPGLKDARAAGPPEFKAATGVEFKVTAADGIIEGYAATWDRDLGGDRFVKGAFEDVIAEEFTAGRVKIFREHRTAIGLPLELKEDSTGLYVVAKIQPGDTQDGDETINLADRGVYDSFSVAWIPDRKEMHVVTEGSLRTRVIPRVASLPHAGILSDPMNPAAQITAVKSAEDLGAVLSDLAELKALLNPEPAQLKTLWELSAALEHMAILEDIRRWGELSHEEAEAARELIDHLLSITEETKRHLPRPAGGVPAELAGLVGRMSDYANQLRN